MKFRTSYLMLGLLSVSGVTLAEGQDYQHEVQINYSSNSDDSDHQAWKGSYRYYGAPIQQADRPYLLTDFLGATSNFGVSYQEADDNKNDSFFVDGTYFIDSNWYVEGNYSNSSSNKYDLDLDAYGVSLGYYFTDSSAVYVSYNYAESDFNSSTDDSMQDTDSNAFSIGIKHFSAFETTSGLYVQAEIGRVNSDTSVAGGDNSRDYSDNITHYDVNVDWYISDYWSVGAGYARQDGDINDDEAIQIGSDYVLMLSDNIAAHFGVDKIIEPDDIDGVFYNIKLSGRF